MFRSLALFLLASLLIGSDLHGAQSTAKPSKPGPTKIRISQSAVNTRSAVLWIAERQGFFARNGLEVETIYLRSSNLLLAQQQLADGRHGHRRCSFRQQRGAPVLSAVSGGQDLKIVASPSNRPVYDVVVRPEIRDAKDLRVKRFGVTNIVESVLTSLLEAQFYIASPANKSVVVQTLARQMKISDPSVLEEGYQALHVGFERKPYPSVEGLRNIQRMIGGLNPKVARVKAEEIIESRFVRKLDDSGYIDSLFAKGN